MDFFEMSLEQLFAAADAIQPTEIDPETGVTMEPEKPLSKEEEQLLESLPAARNDLGGWLAQFDENFV